VAVLQSVLVSVCTAFFDVKKLLILPTEYIYTRWAKSRCTVCSILYTHFWPTLYISYDSYVKKKWLFSKRH